MKQPSKPEVAATEIATNIAFISAGMKKLNEGRLNTKAITVLLYHSCGRTIPMNDIQRVMNELESLEKTYLKQRRDK